MEERDRRRVTDKMEREAGFGEWEVGWEGRE